MTVLTVLTIWRCNGQKGQNGHNKNLTSKIKNSIMARYVPTAGFESFTGALSKKKDYAHRLVTRRKGVKDPITGEVVGLGPKEIYAQEPRE